MYCFFISKASYKQQSNNQKKDTITEKNCKFKVKNSPDNKKSDSLKNEIIPEYKVSRIHEDSKFNPFSARILCKIKHLKKNNQL